MYKKMSVLSIFCSLNSYADDLRSFKDLEDALNSGKNVHLVISLQKCQKRLNMDIHTPKTLSLNLGSVRIYSDRISASNLHFTRSNPNYNDRSIFEYENYTFDAQNILTISSQNLDALNYQPLDSIVSFSCLIGDAAKVFSSKISER